MNLATENLVVRLCSWMIPWTLLVMMTTDPGLLWDSSGIRTNFSRPIEEFRFGMNLPLFSILQCRSPGQLRDPRQDHLHEDHLGGRGLEAEVVIEEAEEGIEAGVKVEIGKEDAVVLEAKVDREDQDLEKDLKEEDQNRPRRKAQVLSKYPMWTFPNVKYWISNFWKTASVAPSPATSMTLLASSNLIGAILGRRTAVLWMLSLLTSQLIKSG